MPETEAQGVNDGVLRDVDFGPRGRVVAPALDFVPDQDLAMLSVPLYLKEPGGAGGAMSAARSYTVIVTGGRRLCIPTSDLPLRISSMPVFIDVQSRWREAELRQFLDGTYICPQPGELLTQVATLFGKYLDIPMVESRLLACWSMATHWYPLWPAFGLLAVNGSFGSGKSRLLTVLSQIVFQPVNLANCTAAAMVRCQRTSALIDEAELIGTGSSGQRELKLILQASYRKEGGEVVRCAGRGRLAKWAVYGPKAIAAIKPLDDVLASRAIVIKMHRSVDAAKTALQLDSNTEDWAAVRAAVHATALLSWRDLMGTRVDTGALAARRREVFLPVLQVAQWADPSGALAAELVDYAVRSGAPVIQAAAMTDDERKIVTALAASPDLGADRWWTADEVKQVVAARFPELVSMSLANLGLSLSKHRVWSEKRHTVRGKVMKLDAVRVTLLATLPAR